MPIPPASCSSPGVKGPSLVAGGSTGSQVSPVRTPHGLELLPGSMEWTWGRSAGSCQPGLPSLPGAAGTQSHGADCRTQAAGAQGCEVRVLPHLLTTKASLFFLCSAHHAWTVWHTVVTVVCAKSLQSCLILCKFMDCVTHQSPLSMGFSSKEYCSGLPCPPTGDLRDPGIEPASLTSPLLSGRCFTSSATWEAR